MCYIKHSTLTSPRFGGKSLPLLKLEQSQYKVGNHPNVTRGARPGSPSEVAQGADRSPRLKILYYTSQEEVTPPQLARRLHLRAPTVTHHLTELRLAGLVNLTFRGQEKSYQARFEAVEHPCASLRQFPRNPPTPLKTHEPIWIARLQSKFVWIFLKNSGVFNPRSSR